MIYIVRLCIYACMLMLHMGGEAIKERIIMMMMTMAMSKGKADVTLPKEIP